MILYFNFSGINPDVDNVELSFEDHCEQVFYSFYKAYASILGDDFLIGFDRYTTAEARIEYIARFCKDKNLPIYLFIDEYDNFSNTILSQHGEQKYADITHGNGFLRLFFNKIKEIFSDNYI